MPTVFGATCSLWGARRTTGLTTAERLSATLAEYAGLRREQLYEIARVGYQLMNSGKLGEACEIYRGLVAADPFDSVFHCHLAAVNLRLGRTDAALAGFDAALRFDRADVDALRGRGETYFKQGRLGEAVKDLRAASTLRERSHLADGVVLHG